ncbi:MAG: hypothetical protein BJ554DRAFT_7132 [Olpidium bornovanus]|uniref:non-specific serine/threonine protein kinase n=1 Tax=Olpidium bornovanus TaxID=278681 RepID=A0A8H8DJF1_9FUNG|nr:MAG: hypothetical protein BJ554DRAFT_7132 [Olpidium bornovanus]
MFARSVWQGETCISSALKTSRTLLAKLRRPYTQKNSNRFFCAGDYQFEVYRQMREETKADWRSHCPKTNWFHYLVDKLLTAKSPTRDKDARARRELQGLQKRLKGYPSGCRAFNGDRFFAWYAAGCQES